jgi:hypothetical protein
MDAVVLTSTSASRAPHSSPATSMSSSSTLLKRQQRHQTRRHTDYTGLMLNVLLYGSESWSRGPGPSPRCSSPASIVFTWTGFERCVCRVNR